MKSKKARISRAAGKKGTRHSVAYAVANVEVLLHCTIYNRGSRQAVGFSAKHMLRVKFPVHGMMPYR